MVKHKIFGKKKDVKYTERKGAYLIPIKGNRVAVVKTTKGLFLIGGGINPNETDSDAIIRECYEEVGCNAVVGKLVCSAETYEEHPVIGFFHPVQTYYSGDLSEQFKIETEENHHLIWIDYNELKGNLFVEMQNWALNECVNYHLNKNLKEDQ